MNGRAQQKDRADCSRIIPVEGLRSVAGGQRIVITGIGLASPNGNNLTEFQSTLLSGKSGVRKFNVRYMGDVIAGVCPFDPLKYQKKKDHDRQPDQGHHR